MNDEQRARAREQAIELSRAFGCTCELDQTITFEDSDVGLRLTVSHTPWCPFVRSWEGNRQLSLRAVMVYPETGEETGS